MLAGFFVLPEWLRYVIAGTVMFWGMLIACFGYVYAIAVREAWIEFRSKTKRERKKIIDDAIEAALNDAANKLTGNFD
jgi:hypothetical protein